MNAQNANTILAMQNIDVLRVIEVHGPHSTIDWIAKQTGRDKSNLRKTLAKLEAAGFVEATENFFTLNDAALPMLQAADVAAGREIGVPGFVGLHHAQIFPSALNPRRDFDSDEAVESLDELRQDILQNGLLQSLLVRPMPNAGEMGSYLRVLDAKGDALPLYEIIAGERRWRAIGDALAEGDWPLERPIPCQVITTDDRGHTLRALAENLQRRALNPLEEARAFKAEVEAGMSTAELAERLSVTQRYIQLRIELLKLGAEEQARMLLPKEDEAHLSVTKAREELRKPKPAALPTAAPLELLILAEVMHKVTKAPANGYQTTECAPDARETIGVEFAGSWLSFIPCAYADGRSYVSIGYNGREVLLRLMPDFADPFALNRLRCEVLGEDAFAAHDAALYVTPWLNGPWEPSAEATAKIAEREAVEQSQKKAEQARRERLQAAVAKASDLVDGLRVTAAPAPLDHDFASALGQIAGTLPWRVDDRGYITASDGSPVNGLQHGGAWLGEFDSSLIVRRLVVEAVNAAAGLATPSEPEKTPEEKVDAPLDRAAFEAAIAAELEALKIDAKADGVLDTALQEIGCDFGDPDYGWTAADAKILVHEAYLGE